MAAQSTGPPRFQLVRSSARRWLHRCPASPVPSLPPSCPARRPRSRKEIMEDPRYYELREHLITFLNDKSHIRPSREPQFKPSPDMAAELAAHGMPAAALGSPCPRKAHFNTRAQTGCRGSACRCAGRHPARAGRWHLHRFRCDGSATSRAVSQRLLRPPSWHGRD